MSTHKDDRAAGRSRHLLPGTASILGAQKQTAVEVAARQQTQRQPAVLPVQPKKRQIPRQTGSMGGQQMVADLPGHTTVGCGGKTKPARVPRIQRNSPALHPIQPVHRRSRWLPRRRAILPADPTVCGQPEPIPCPPPSQQSAARPVGVQRTRNLRYPFPKGPTPSRSQPRSPPHTHKHENPKTPRHLSSFRPGHPATVPWISVSQHPHDTKG